MIALARSKTLYDGILGIIVSPPQNNKTNRPSQTLSCKEILKRVILLSVIKIWLFFFDCFINSGITEPLLPITLPYLTTEKDMSLLPFILFAARNNLSEQSFVAP